MRNCLCQKRNLKRQKKRLLNIKENCKMETWINLIQGIGIVFFEILCCKIFVSSFFEKRENFLIWQKISLPVLSVLVYLGAMIFSNNIFIKTCCTFLTVSFIMLSCYKVKLIVRIIFTNSVTIIFRNNDVNVS